jgi:serine/threonine-protein kinase
MKVLLPDLASMPELADRFLREIKVLATLDHPNIAQLHTAVRAGNQLLMVMEFIDGETLEHRLRQGPLPLAQALDYIGQVLSALDFAHAHGVVHRDIKPANMMLTPSGVVKLMDFGIAKAAADQKLTMTGTTMGSVYYMSPEQIQGASTLDARADLYSVGVTLYELVTGKRPFDGDSQYSIMAAHLEKTPIPPMTLDPRLPQALNDAILMSVAKDPNGRFQSGAAFRNALLGVAAQMQAPTAPVVAPTPVAAPAVSAGAIPPPAAAAHPKSKRWLWMAMGGVAVAVALVGAIEFAPWKPTKAAAPPPQTSTAQAQQPALPAEVTTAPSIPLPDSAPGATIPAVSAPVAASKPPARSLPKVASPPPVVPAASAPQPVQPQTTPSLAPPAQPQQQPVGPSRAEVLAARDHLAKLQVRASSIHDSLANLQSSMQAQGVALNAKFTQPAGLMDTYLRLGNEALNQSDLASVREYADKAERQVEILEKLLNL